MCIYQKGGKCTIGLNQTNYTGEKVIKCGPNCSYYSDPEHPTNHISSNSKHEDNNNVK